MKKIVHLGLACIFIGMVASKPADNQAHGKDRVKNQKLSHEEHFDGDGHNTDYDHDAFLGEEEARTFEDLSPEESKARLGEIVEKIDENKDGKVDVDELQRWVEKQQKSYVFKDVDTQWVGHNVDGDDKITFDEYNKTSYSGLPGFDMIMSGVICLPTQNRYISEHTHERWQLHNTDSDNYLTLDEYIKSTYASTEEELLKLDEAEQIDFKEMIKRDKRRWNGADQNGDGNLNKDEFSAFLHPEEFDHMRDVVIDETMEDIDKNKDGTVSLEEYIGDMFIPENGEEEPDWVKTEREQFGQYRDKNSDGVMDRKEVGDWIMPRDYDHALAEARHLIHESDKDGDKKLTKQEIIDQYDLFVGSQVTDFGEALVKHDEF